MLYVKKASQIPFLLNQFDNAFFMLHYAFIKYF